MLGVAVMASCSDGPLLEPAVMDIYSFAALLLYPASSLAEINCTYTISETQKTPKNTPKAATDKPS
jgi:hypothetical protein